MKPAQNFAETMILVVEDEPNVRNNILDLLELEGFNLLAADNGWMGLDLAQQHHPDLIICDVMMPEMDGFQLVKRLQQNQDTCLIPVVFLTAKTSMTDLREGMNLGADDYLIKPFTRIDLLAAVQARLVKRQNVNDLEAKIQALQQGNLLKDEILCSVSHDLKAPLTNMKIAIQMLSQDQLNPEQRKRYLSILEAECLKEAALVNALLDWQKFESGSYTLACHPINVVELVRQLVDPFQARAAEYNQHFSLDLPDTAPLLLSDRIYLERILTELLNNACKYTPTHGNLYLGVVTESGPKAVSLTFIIKNSASIPEAVLPLIFDPFYRGPGANRQEGTGLGLAIVNQMIQRLKGTITATSQEGWTTFEVKLPL